MDVLLIFILIWTNVAAYTVNNVTTEDNSAVTEASDYQYETLLEPLKEGNTSTIQVNSSTTEATETSVRRGFEIMPIQVQSLNENANDHDNENYYSRTNCEDTSVLLQILSVLTSLQPEGDKMFLDVAKLKQVLELITQYIGTFQSNSNQSKGEENLYLQSFCTNIDKLVNNILDPYKSFTHFNLQFDLPASIKCQHAYENILKYINLFQQNYNWNTLNMSIDIKKPDNNDIKQNINLSSLYDLNSNSSNVYRFLQNYRPPTDEITNLYVNGPQQQKSISENSVLNTNWLEQSQMLNIQPPKLKNFQDIVTPTQGNVPQPDLNNYRNPTSYIKNDTPQITTLPGNYVLNSNSNLQENVINHNQKLLLENMYDKVKKSYNNLPQVVGMPLNSNYVLNPIAHNTLINNQASLYHLQNKNIQSQDPNYHGGNQPYANVVTEGLLNRGGFLSNNNLNGMKITNSYLPNQYTQKNFQNPYLNPICLSQNCQNRNQDRQPNKIMLTNLSPFPNLPQRNPYLLNGIYTDKNQQGYNVLNLGDWQRLQGVTNYNNVKSTPNNNHLVEITYVLQRPKNVQYEPLYWVTYKLPYLIFQESLNNLLVQKPFLVNNPNLLYQELLSSINFTEPLISKLGLNNEDASNLKWTNLSMVKTNSINEPNFSLKDITVETNFVSPGNPFILNNSNIKSQQFNHQQSKIYRVQTNNPNGGAINRLPILTAANPHINNPLMSQSPPVSINQV